MGNPILIMSGGFNFENSYRNTLLEREGFKSPGYQKTGTTLSGLIYKDGVVLAADTRATGGSIVCDKNCFKIHYITDAIYCCGAGTAADTEHLTEQIASKLRLLSLATGQEPRVVTAKQLLTDVLWRHQGHISAALILGGINPDGSSELWNIHPHGSADKLPFTTMGSGSLASMAIMEAGFEEDMELEAAKQLAHDAIEAGVTNDLGSGSNVDLMVIARSPNGGKPVVTNLRNMDVSHSQKRYKAPPFSFPRGTTEVLSETTITYGADAPVAMDVSQ